MNPATFTNSIRSYLILDAEEKYDQNLDKTETIEVLRVPWDKVDTLIESGELKQLFSINAILLAQKKIKQLEGEI